MSNLDPWYTNYPKENLYEFIDIYKYSLQKILSVEQIISLRKAITVDNSLINKDPTKKGDKQYHGNKKEPKNDPPLRARSKRAAA